MNFQQSKKKRPRSKSKQPQYLNAALQSLQRWLGRTPGEKRREKQENMVKEMDRSQGGGGQSKSGVSGQPYFI